MKQIRQISFCIILVLGLKALNFSASTNSSIDYQTFTQFGTPGYTQVNCLDNQFINDDESEIKAEESHVFRLEQPIHIFTAQGLSGPDQLYLLYPFLVDLPPPCKS